MKMEYDVVVLTGDAQAQKTALNAAGAEGWMLVHLEHKGITQAVAYFARRRQGEDRGENPQPGGLSAKSDDADGSDGNKPGTVDAPAAVTVQNAESVVVQEAQPEAPKPDQQASVETSGSASTAP